MNISIKELKQTAKEMIKRSRIILIITYPFLFGIIAMSFIGSLLDTIPLVGLFINLIIMYFIVLLSLIFIKLQVDFSNDILLDFSCPKLRKAIYALIWSLIYSLPGIILCAIGIILFIVQSSKNLIDNSQLIDYGSIIKNLNPLTIVITVTLIIAGCIYIVFIRYSTLLSVYMVYDKKEYDNYTARQIVKESIRITKGYKLKLFILDLSFIGWILLFYLVANIPLIGTFLSTFVATTLACRMTLTQILFYKEIA